MDEGNDKRKVYNITKVTEYLLKFFDNNMLGRIANYHFAISDMEKLGAQSRLALQLSAEYSSKIKQKIFL